MSPSTPSLTLRRLALACLLSCVSLGHASSPEQVAVPRFTHPGAGQTFYFVMTDRFANGSTANDTGGYLGGPDDHGFDPARISHYHGGDFAGLTRHLDYLKGLGITAVWVTPPFKNKPFQAGSAGYHGYWTTDFLNIDPHLGTNEDYSEFVRQTHARGMRVYMDIITNHTADVIQNEGRIYDYVTRADAPYQDADGRQFDERTVAFNGLGDPAAFPTLAAGQSFPYVPVVPSAEKAVKNPAWLNEVTFYHNRGNTGFVGENSTLGDFVGLDDLFTEHPRVVSGFIEIFRSWLERGADGFRIDTVRHVNNEFWHAFAPTIRARARQLGRPAFLQFAEVYNEAGDPSILSEFSTHVPIDATIDFGFFVAARKFVSKGGTAAELAEFIDRDDYYTDHDSNVHSTTTFLGNHDAGRFAYFLQQDNKESPEAEIAALSRLGHGLLYLSRGQPVIYYGDEQGMIGRGGNDQQARESMFASRAPAFATAPLLATTRTGADDKFDAQHPFYRLFSELGAVRAAHPALRTGAMIPRATTQPGLFAFSRIDREEFVEFIVVMNNSRTETLSSAIATSQRPGASLRLVFDSRTADLCEKPPITADADGRIDISVAPLEFAVWRADSPLGAASAPQINFIAPGTGATLEFHETEIDGLIFPSRKELRAEVTGGDGVAEVTFVMLRASRPGQYEFLGTDDAAPYRVFWSPPPDLEPGEKLEFIATVDDLRGQSAAASISGITLAPNNVAFGIRGAKTPVITRALPATVAISAGWPLIFTIQANGTGPLEYQWVRNNREIPGATGPNLAIASADASHGGEYRVLVRNLAGTTVSTASRVTVGTASTHPARIEKHPAFPSSFITPRQIDVWLPPGYDADPDARYPVVYMHDGQNLFDPATSYIGVPWSPDVAMMRLVDAGESRPAIIVGIWNTPARMTEYMPQKATQDGRFPYIASFPDPAGTPLTSDAYLRFIVEELKPFIDHTYRTLPGRKHTSIMGSSMGGLISAYAVAEYPEVFGGAACLSNAWQVGDGAVIDYLAKHLPPPETHRFYFDYGTDKTDVGCAPYQDRMDQVMRDTGYNPGPLWMSHVYSGAEHSERSWRERVDIPLRFLLE